MGATNRFSGAHMRATDSFSKAPEEYTDFQEVVEKQFVALQL
jgi:hypothetical protein